MQINLKTVQSCEALFSELRSARLEREAAWRELSRWLCPWRGVFDAEGADAFTRDDLSRFTGIASSCCLAGASGMTSGMTPRNVAWFKPEFGEKALMEAGGARAWLDALDNLLKETLAAGGFYQAIQTFNLDLIWSGCALLYSEKGKAATLRYECVQVGSFFVALDAEGRLDAVGREWKLSARALADIFGEASLSPSARADLKASPWKKRRLRMLAVCDGQGSMPVKSRYWEEGHTQFLRQSAFHEMPYFYAVWNEGATPYGTGPGDECLADARQMDILERNKLAGLAKIIDPPLAVPVSLKDEIDLSPGAVNYVASDRERIEPILDLAPYAAALRGVQEEIANVQRRLAEGLKANIFNSVPLESRPAGMSATEFLERKRETLQQLGPIISAYEPNVLMPLLMRQMRALDRAQLVPPLPDALQGLDVFMTVEFISPMANALRQTSVEAIRAFAQDFMGMMQGIQNPEMLDKLDVDQLVDEMATGLGVPGGIIRSDEEVAAIREQRAKAQEMAQAQAAAMEGPGGAEDPGMDGLAGQAEGPGL